METENKTREDIDYKQFIDDHPLLEKFRQAAPGSFKH